MDSARLVRGAPADLWRNTLAGISTWFGRLVYLSGLRDPNTGAYQHYGLVQVFGDEEADRTLRDSHMQIFIEWLSFSMERKKAELDGFLDSVDGGARAVIENWLRAKPYRTLPPVEAREVERRHFVSEVEVLLELLRREHGLALPGPEA